MLKVVYTAVASACLGLYLLGSFLGWEVGGYSRESATEAAARQSSGGHRSHVSFWYFGFRGGK
jgi:hypothetical protein